MKPIGIHRRRFLEVSSSGAIGLALGSPMVAHEAQAASEKAMALLSGFTWIKHAGFRVQDGKTVIYFDPWQLTASPHDADLVFVSHEHGDHCDPPSVRKILKDGTKVVTEPDSAGKLRGTATDITTMKPGDEITIGGLKVNAVRAYNISKSYHPKSKNWLGFAVTLSDGRRIYHAGDTDHIPEMADIETDVALLPAGGKYTMDAEEAAEAAKTIQPGVAVPMHYGSAVGSPQDGKRFEEAVAGAVEVMVFEHGQTIPPAITKVRTWDRQ